LYAVNYIRCLLIIQYILQKSSLNYQKSPFLWNFLLQSI